MNRRLFLLAALMLAGCNQFRKLTGTEKESFPQVGGAWSGAADIGGTSRTVAVSIPYQDRATISGTAKFGDVMAGYLSGYTTDGRIEFYISQDKSCPQPYAVTGTVDGGRMDVHIKGPGNPGALCYGEPVDVDAILIHQ